MKDAEINAAIKRIALTTLSVFLFLYSHSQDTIRNSLDNNLTSIYSNTNQNKQISLSFGGENYISKKRIAITSNTNYSLTLSPSISGNELTQRLTLSDKKMLFTTYTYNYSLYRQLHNNWIGFGRYIAKGKQIKLSYALFYERIDYFSGKTIKNFRHSFKIGMNIKKGPVEASTDLYYQPGIIHIKDCVVYGVTRLVFSPSGSINFTIQNVIDYRSLNDVRMINNITFGIGYTFRN